MIYFGYFFLCCSFGSLEKHTRFYKTIMVNTYTRSQTKTAETPSLWNGIYLVLI